MGINLEEYKRKKGQLPEKDYGTLFTFTSDRNGVSEITEHLIWETYKSGRRIQPKPECEIYTYKLKDGPYEVSIKEDEEVGCNVHLFSGFGDCWSGSTFGSKNRESLEEARQKEFERIKKKYLNK